MTMTSLGSRCSIREGKSPISPLYHGTTLTVPQDSGLAFASRGASTFFHWDEAFFGKESRRYIYTHYEWSSAVTIAV